jgi:hypothetical protein
MNKQNEVYIQWHVLFSFKKNEVVICITVCMNLVIMLCVKRGKHKRTNTVWFYLYEVPRIGKFRETESRIDVTMG